MEVSVNPFQIDYNIARMTENFVPEDCTIYEECSICYESFTNKSFINECLHPFCYKCITDWTQVKAVCPLCIRPITKILHNIRSQDDYDIKEVVPPKIDVLAEIESDFIFGIDDTDTDSSYGGMESMDADSDADVEYGDDFNFQGEDNFGGNTTNVFEYLSDNEEFHDNEEYYDGDASVHSSNETESDDDFKVENEDSDEDIKVENEDNNENHSSDNSSENEDDPNVFFNTVSDFEIEEEQEEEEEYDCDLNEDDEDDDADEEYSESNYFDNFFEDAENFDEEEQENEPETFDVSDDTDNEHEESSEQSISDDDDYYLSDRC